MIALFIVYDDNHDLESFSRKVEDTTRETLMGIVEDEGYRLSEIHDMYIIDGELSHPGREYLED